MNNLMLYFKAWSYVSKSFLIGDTNIIVLQSFGEMGRSSTPCIVSKYEYRQNRGYAAKMNFLADQCGCDTWNGPIL